MRLTQHRSKIPSFPLGYHLNELCYSPDLNPIEHFWFKIKNHVKKIKNEFENFIDAICYVFKKDTISMI
jgi:hypothetical protein